MKSIEDLEVWVSPLTHRIYAGFFNERTGRSTQNKDITNKVLSCVCHHLDKNGEYNHMVTPSGELTWKHTDGESHD